MKRIMFATGGTLGHINPALKVISELIKTNDYKIYLLSTSKEKNTNLYNNYSFLDNVDIYYLNVKSFNRKQIFKNFKYLFLNFKTIKEIKKMLKELDISLVVSMGGAIGSLCVYCANKLKIKTIIHEQNKAIGLGNKLVLKKSTLALSNMDIGNSFKVVGNPIFFSSKKNIILDTILIFGGSNGSTFLNDFFIKNITSIKNLFKYHKIVLITGNKYYQNNLSKINNTINENINIYPSMKSLSDLYKRSYIVISRAGATTLSEIITYKLISLVIPSPNVTNNHQVLNATHYKDLGLVKMIEEKNITKETIENILIDLKNESIRNKMLDLLDKYNIGNPTELFINEIRKVLSYE